MYALNLILMMMFGLIVVVIVLGRVMLFDSIALKRTTQPIAVSCSFCVN